MKLNADAVTVDPGDLAGLSPAILKIIQSQAAEKGIPPETHLGNTLTQTISGQKRSFIMTNMNTPAKELSVVNAIQADIAVAVAAAPAVVAASPVTAVVP